VVVGVVTIMPESLGLVVRAVVVTAVRPRSRAQPEQLTLAVAVAVLAETKPVVPEVPVL